MTSRGWLLLAFGVAVMVTASVWAPPQPELITGGSCNVAQCGTLEDPARWSQAWWLWLPGAGASLMGTALVVRGTRVPRWPVLLSLLVVGPALLLSVAFVATFVSLLTSVHGAATTATALVVLPAVALTASWVKGSVRRGQQNVGSSRDSGAP